MLISIIKKIWIVQEEASFQHRLQKNVHNMWEIEILETKNMYFGLQYIQQKVNNRSFLFSFFYSRAHKE